MTPLQDPLRPDELTTDEAGPGAEEMVAAMEMGRWLDRAAEVGDAGPSAGFVDRVMIAVAREPRPSPVSALRRAISDRRPIAAIAALLDAWRVMAGPGRPGPVRLQAAGLALSSVLLVGLSVLAVGGGADLFRTPASVPGIGGPGASDGPSVAPGPTSSVDAPGATVGVPGTDSPGSGATPSASAGGLDTGSTPSPSPTTSTAEPSGSTGPAPGSSTPATPRPGGTPRPTATPAASPHPTPTATGSPAPSGSPSPSPSPSASPLPSDTPGPTQTPDSSETPRPSETPGPSQTPQPTLTPSPT